MKSIKNYYCILVFSVITTSILAQGPNEFSIFQDVFPDNDTSIMVEAETIIKSFVEDYKTDRHAREKFVYRAEMKALRAIYNGEMNALTAQAKAFSTDYAPLDVQEINNFKPTEEDDSAMNAFSFHFWTKGFPEVIPFRPDATRKAHGSGVTVFYYEKGLRTDWYNIMPGERVREDAREQAMPFPMMGVLIKGTAKGIVDGEPITVSAGNTVFIPANVHHKWWNETDEPVELILIMFGKGA